ncbi:hypothetical protein [Fischerella thermalis]|uniref:Uncharacterized protein n=1 Tax=Fischerella thermalis CCMEE 5318 TaxID=2019666 RepID=A0A2N6LPX7_9CYAN|nr:hypothetical protein [Fischerella thermalis]PMB27974.1 hypothetical protein CEN46_00360 [Fischerella thermalis CCMEE 5318]PMB42629.1 hypothetical protein CEN47_01090 [Fischerella thermalis CCMEE 5319]
MTHKISLRQPRNIINALAGCLTFLAAVTAVKSENPNAKTLAWIVAVSSAAIGIVNEASSHLYEDNANNQIEAFIKPKDEKIAELTKEVEIKLGIENRLRLEQSVNKKLLDTVANLKAELEVYQGKAEEEKLFADAVIDKFLFNIKEILNSHIEQCIEKLKKSIDTKLRQIKDERIITRLNKFQSDLDVKSIYYKNLITQIERDENLGFVNDTIEIYSRIHEDLASLKVKFIRTLNISDRLKLYNAVNQEQAKSGLANIRNPKPSYAQVLAKLEESERVAAKNEQYIKNVIAELEKAMERLAQKEEEIKALKRPQYWSTPTRDDQWLANIIIGYFEQLGIILDRAYNDYEQWQATLYFHIDRNRRLITAKDLNEHSQNIEQLGYTLNRPEFKFDSESGLMSVWVQIASDPAQKIIPFIRIARD